MVITSCDGNHFVCFNTHFVSAPSTACAAHGCPVGVSGICLLANLSGLWLSANLSTLAAGLASEAYLARTAYDSIWTQIVEARRSLSKNDKSRRRRRRQAARRGRSEESAVVLHASTSPDAAMCYSRIDSEGKQLRPRQPHRRFQAKTVGRGRRCRLIDPSRAKEVAQHRILHADVF